MARSLISKFLHLESSSGICLLLATFIALFFANSPWSAGYEAIFHAPILLAKPLLFWINDGLMTFFFLLVGLELKREFVIGELADRRQVILPSIAALGGMLLPAIVYGYFNAGDRVALRGFAIPVATDIAFALGVLSLFGKRVPLGLKLFLMALAIFDDIGAIIIIAIFYTRELSYVAMLFALLCLIILFVMHRYRVSLWWLYLIVGIALWFAIVKAGVHGAIAGVIFAFMLPLKTHNGPFLQPFEELLHPWIAYGIVPLFAFANAGLTFSTDMQISAVSMGIITGLFIGKQLGVFTFAATVIKLGWATLPKRTSWWALYGVSILCGIGFTMSLFIGALSFTDPAYLWQVRLGVLLASGLSVILGSIVLIFTLE